MCVTATIIQNDSIHITFKIMVYNFFVRNSVQLLQCVQRWDWH